MIEPTGAGWRVVAASVAGTGHVADGTPCQDRYQHRCATDLEGNYVLIAAVADGASFAANGSIGADTAVSRFVACAAETLAGRPITSVGPAECRDWISKVRAAVLREAEDGGLAVDALACTFAAVVVADAAAFAVQIGDCIIAVRDGAGPAWRIAIWPQKGEYPNQTRFLTGPDAEADAETCSLGAGIGRIAISTDGLEDVCLDRAARVVFSPFFEDIAATVADTPDGQVGELAPALERFLSSEAMNSRTTDDKTLVLAIRPRAGR